MVKLLEMQAIPSELNPLENRSAKTKRNQSL